MNNTFTVLLFFLSDVFFSKSEEGAADLHAEAAKLLVWDLR